MLQDTQATDITRIPERQPALRHHRHQSPPHPVKWNEAPPRTTISRKTHQLRPSATTPRCIAANRRPSTTPSITDRNGKRRHRSPYSCARTCTPATIVSKPTSQVSPKTKTSNSFRAITTAANAVGCDKGEYTPMADVLDAEETVKLEEELANK